MKPLVHRKKNSHYLQSYCGKDFNSGLGMRTLESDSRRLMERFDANEGRPGTPGNVEQNEAPSSILLSEIISALSYALDLTEGQPMGHSVRACMIGMRIAQQAGVSVPEQADL